MFGSKKNAAAKVKDKRNNASIKPEVGARLVKLALIAAPLALAISLVCAVMLIRQSNEQAPDVVAEIGEVTDVQNWGQDYMLLWLGGAGPRPGQEETTNQTTLRERTSAPFDVVLPTVPAQVINIRPVSQPRRVSGEIPGDALWHVEYEATAQFPGEQTKRRLTYALDIVQHAGTYQALALPRQITPVRTPFKANTVYQQRAQEGSPLVTSAQAFAQAYLIPNAGGNLGSTVTANFDSEPVASSPYQKVEVVDLVWYKFNSGVDLNNVKPGDRVYALITVKAEVSTATYQYMQLPVVMAVLENGQWAVDGFNEFVDSGTFMSPDSGESLQP